MSNEILFAEVVGLQRAIIAGAAKVISRQDHLNKINVFPVSDSDTGTNVSITLRAVVNAIANKEIPSLKIMLQQVADAALDDARGNSGIIFAQFFQGFYVGVHDDNKMTAQEFAKAFNQGVDYAFLAVDEPKLGTILSVLKDTANALNKLVANGVNNFTSLLQQALEHAEASLQKTPEQLRILKKHHVVDAGGQAFVDFLQGALHSLISREPIDIEALLSNYQVTPELDMPPLEDGVRGAYQFCTECMVQSNETIDSAALKSKLHDLGDCIVVAGSDTRKRVHIHVNEPQTVFSLCGSYGDVSNEKADDMYAQVKFKEQEKPAKVAIVTDTATDMHPDLIQELNIHQIPFRLQIGSETFLDKITIQPHQFSKYLYNPPAIFSTSQPNYKDFANRYQYLSSHYEGILSIHISARVSATIVTAGNAIPESMHNRARVLPSCSVSIGQGLIVEYAARLAKKGLRLDEIAEKTTAIIKKTSAYVIFGDLKYPERGGRIPRFVRKISQWFKINPVLMVSHHKQGKPQLGGILLGHSHPTQKFARFISRKLKNKNSYKVAIAHCDAENKANELHHALMKHNPSIVSISVMECGVGLSIHSGPGALAVAIQQVDAD